MEWKDSDNSSPKITVVDTTLEIHHERGVIYVHAKDEETVKLFKGATLLRIGNLPKPIPRKALDIAFGHGCDWGSESVENIHKDTGEEVK
jgi:hypothetical protein